MKYSVYHIYEEGKSSLDLGYIGCSSNVEERLRKHRKYTLNGSDRQKLYEELRKLPLSSIKYRILFTGSKEEAFEYENKLRPSPNMGWNSGKGGIAWQCQTVEVNGIVYASFTLAKEATGYDYATLKKIQQGIPVFQPQTGSNNVRSKPVTLMDSKTGKEMSFVNLQAAWDWIGKHGAVNGNIAKQKAKGRPAYGYYWNY